MANFTGTITIPFEIEYATKPETAEKIVNYVLDRFGEHNFDHLTFHWDNPEWILEQTEESANG
jgi:hypothetical protein